MLKSRSAELCCGVSDVIGIDGLVTKQRVRRYTTGRRCDIRNTEERARSSGARHSAITFTQGM